MSKMTLYFCYAQVSHCTNVPRFISRLSLKIFLEALGFMLLHRDEVNM